ncbi:MAG: GNAT family N-acetyltransferase [Clostridia bacterium]|nr:GNAT family N-acetyltransferase [Clostridia bacterium]
MAVIVEEITEKELEKAIEIWNEVVEDGRAFPQTEPLSIEEGKTFFESQSYTGIAKIKETGEVIGLYILHPNNVGRCGHIANASYAVERNARGHHAGEALVKDCLLKGKELGFKILQFNAVVASNTAALSLYKKLGFKRLGTIPGGFLNIDGVFEDIILHYIEL